MKHAFKEHVRGGFDPIVAFLSSARIHPNVLTLLGLGFAIVGAVTAASGRIREAGLWLLISGIFDMLDGPVARRMGIDGRSGAFIDSTLDRFSEGVFFAGLAWFYAGSGDSGTVLAIALVMMSSFQVSYARARAEGLGEECKVGLMERPERLVLMIVACLVAGPVLPILLWVLAALTTITAIYRILHVVGKIRD